MKTLLTLSLMALSCNAFADSSFDRNLTKSEMMKLLPEYVNTVEKQAATVPSVEEARTYAILAHTITDPVYGLFGKSGIIGLQTHSAEKLREMIAYSMEELKEFTPEKRIAAATDLLAGFQGAPEAGKISCTLGYYRGGRMASERIVKCEDNRSESGHGDEEGYYDVRSFILSIDALTLMPLSTLKLEHGLAG